MLLRAHLSETDANAELVHIVRLTEAAAAIQDNQFDLVLLDLNLPDSRGLDTLAQLLLLVPNAPIIVLSGIEHDTLALQAVQQGAQDFLVKGKVKAHELARAMLFSLERYRRETELEKLSLQDPLTGLYNRRGFTRFADSTLHQARRSGQELILFLADIDDLKRINDTFGHRAGDEALTDAAELFRQTFRKSQVIARLGGDEFSILVQAPAHNAAMLTGRLESNLRHANARPGRSFALSWSIGHAIFAPTSQDTLETLLSEADRELYAEKEMRKAPLLK